MEFHIFIGFNLLALLGFHFHIHILEIINILFENTITKKFIFYFDKHVYRIQYTKKEENCWHFGKLRNLTNKLRNLTKKHDHEKIINSLGSRIKYFIYCKHNIAVYHQLWKKEEWNERSCGGGRIHWSEIYEFF